MRRLLAVSAIILSLMLINVPKTISESKMSTNLSTLGYELGREPVKKLADPSQMDLDFEYIGSGIFNYEKICNGYNLDYNEDNTLWDMALDERQAHGLGKTGEFQPPVDFNYDNILLITYGRKIVSAEGILFDQFLYWDNVIALALTFDEDYNRGCVYFYQIPNYRFLQMMTASPSYLMINGEKTYMGDSVFCMNTLAEPPEDEIWE